MADVVPIANHQDFTKRDALSINGLLAAARLAHPSELLIIGIDDEGNLFVIGNPPDPGNALWLMELAKQKMLNPSG